MTYGFWHSHGDSPPILVPEIGLELRVRLDRDTSGGGLTIIDTQNASRLGPPLHRHAETEIFRVLSGRYLFEVDGRRTVADAGDVICVPGGAAHAFVNLSDEPSHQTILIIPGMDAAAFFTGLAEVMRGGVPERAALNRFGHGWGMEFLGPPLRP